MLERIVAQVVLSLVSWLDRRISSGQSAVDAGVDRDALGRAGDRIREWLRQDGVRRRVDPDAGRSNDEEPRVPQG